VSRNEVDKKRTRVRTSIFSGLIFGAIIGIGSTLTSIKATVGTAVALGVVSVIIYAVAIYYTLREMDRNKQ
jgi:uncharacterized membrane protein (UPF0136 family)